MKEINDNVQINQLIQIIIQTYKKGINRTISSLYKEINNSVRSKTNDVRSKWEKKEAGITLTRDQWAKICTIPHT